MEFQLSIPIVYARVSKSSLLIPEMQLGHFKSRSVELGGSAEYLKYLVGAYLPFLAEVKLKLSYLREPNWNTAYQQKGLNLSKKSFLPDPEDWEKIRNAAAACGVSICFLFAFLMSLEADGHFPKLPKKSSVERNSAPKLKKSGKKLGKFSKLERVWEEKSQTLHRKLKLR